MGRSLLIVFCADRVAQAGQKPASDRGGFQDLRRAALPLHVRQIKMDRQIEAAVEDAYRMEHDSGMVCDHQSRSVATFVAVQRLAQTSDVGVLADAPEWLRDELSKWVANFRLTGEFAFHSSLGKVDHARLMHAVAPLFGE